jgi:hypothetical protein
VKTYEALNIAYSESKDREIECLEIIRRWLHIAINTPQ